LVKQ
jgi:hypothetical protein